MILCQQHDQAINVSNCNNFSFPLHIHRELEISFCQSGTLCVSANGKEITLHPGNMIVFLSNTLHAYHDRGEGKGIMTIVKPDLFPLLSNRLGSGGYILFDGSDDEITQLSHALLHANQSDWGTEIQVGYLYVILGKALRLGKLTGAPAGTDQKVIFNVLLYLSEHYREPVSLHLLSTRFGMSYAALSRSFSEVLNLTFLDYLHFLRIEYVKNLLIHTDMSVADAADEAGFRDIRTFHRVFKHSTGITPLAFRKTYRSTESSNVSPTEIAETRE